MSNRKPVLCTAGLLLALAGCFGPGTAGGPAVSASTPPTPPSESPAAGPRLVIEPGSLSLVLAPPRGATPLYPRSAQLTVYRVTPEGREKLDEGLTWVSADSDRAAVDQQGFVVSGLEAGTVPIRVKHAPSGLEARIDVKVEDLSGAQISFE